MSGIGEASALMSAATWTMSSFIFQSQMEKFSPTLLNLVKGVLTMLIIFVIILIMKIDLFPSGYLRPYVSLCLSGIFGITIGDSLYFRALSELGPRKTLILETLAAPFTGIIAFVFYGTTIPLLGWVGVLFTLVGLYIVVTDEQSGCEVNKHDSPVKFLPQQLVPPKTETATSTQLLIPLQSFNNCEDILRKDPYSFEQVVNISKRRASEMGENQKQKMKKILSSGLANGIVAMFCQALGLVLSHNGLQTVQINALVATFYRLIASLSLLAIIMYVILKERFQYPTISKADNINLVIGILLGNLLSIWLMQLSLEYSRPEISQTLLATAPLFALAIGWFRGEKVSLKAIIGCLIAILGVSVIVSA